MRKVKFWMLGRVVCGILILSIGFFQSCTTPANSKEELVEEEKEVKKEDML